jgi:hypothetical protein
MLFRLAVVLSTASLAVIVACGSSGSGNKTPDAKAIDAKSIDAAPAGLTGLGQKCTADANCPASAPTCVGIGAATMWCAPTCLTGATGTTNGSAQFTGSGAGALNPLPSDAECAAGYSGGTAGTADCDIIATLTPMDTTIMPNKAYTAIGFVCSVGCGGTAAAPTCPTSMTCGTGNFAGLCIPN